MIDFCKPTLYPAILLYHLLDPGVFFCWLFQIIYIDNHVICKDSCMSFFSICIPSISSSFFIILTKIFGMLRRNGDMGNCLVLGSKWFFK